MINDINEAEEVARKFKELCQIAKDHIDKKLPDLEDRYWSDVELNNIRFEDGEVLAKYYTKEDPEGEPTEQEFRCLTSEIFEVEQIERQVVPDIEFDEDAEYRMVYTENGFEIQKVEEEEK